MKYPAAAFLILLCVTIFLAGCEDLPRGDCWPAELSKRVPLGAIFAIEWALSPNGVVTGIVEDGNDDDGITCDDSQSITYGPAYRLGVFNMEAAEVHSASSEEDIISFRDSYVFALYCHGQGMCRVEIDKLFIWVVGIIGMAYAPLEALENYLGPDFTDCTRGLVSDVRFFPHAVCAIVTDKQGITRFYPLNPDEPYWGNTEGKEVGEFSFTKEEFFEWYHNIDLD